MLDARRYYACCDRCTGAAASASAAAMARRRLLRAAVFPPRDATRDWPADGAQALGDDVRDDGAGHQPSARPGFPDTGQLPRSVTGTIIDVSAQVIAIGDAHGEQRFTLTPGATAWRGTRLDPAALRPDEQAVIRLHPTQRGVADRIWASIGRVTGTIIERRPDGLLIDEGSMRPRQAVVIPPTAEGRIQVRFPTLEPGYLLDVIGIRHAGVLEALVPATSQPAYRVDRLPPPPLVSGHVRDAISGSATWHDPAGEPHGVLGVAYPALDPATGCAEAAGGAPPGFARMPYLAVGSVLQIRNDCTGSSCALPVTGCAAIARLFNDRCVTCGTSPRGRVADLTLASFVALGGELERGCFNATITMGR
jgi:hypothetical protein